MNVCAFLLVFLNFGYLAFLPIVFFRRNGQSNLLWWLTTSIFLMSVISLTMSQFGVLPPVTGYNTAVNSAMALACVPLSLASITLMSFALGSHRVPVALWHQTNDAPIHIVTWGAYSKIRHPLYASYILMLLSAFILCPQVFTALSLLAGVSMLNFTAACEEAKLSRSQFGEQYRQYMQQTGRFLPRLLVKSHG
jgi:protein-S-isoprenylcysteine O-methyltransferase Ste14